MTFVDSAASLEADRVCLDNIIFGLQRFGGISNYWMRIASALSGNANFDARLVDPKVSISEIALSSSFPRNQLLSETIPTGISRHLSFDTDACPVAHTSYYRLPRQPVTKYIVTAYDFMYERYRKGPARWIHSTQKRRSLEAADVVVCISSFTRNDALRLMPKLSSAKLTVIPLGVDTAMFYPDQSSHATNQGWNRTVIFVGQRGGYKRFDLALGALAQVPNLTLAVVGKPMAQSEKEAAEKSIPGRWTEVGQIGNDELRRIYSSAFAFIYPSDCEGFGLPILEAMACGCPVVCSQLGSLPEVGGDAPLYAESQHPEAYAEKLRVLEATNVRKSRAESGARNAAKFTWERTIRETLALYKC